MEQLGQGKREWDGVLVLCWIVWFRAGVAEELLGAEKEPRH